MKRKIDSCISSKWRTLSILTLFLPLFVSAQMDLSQDAVFFETQAKEYQQWLKANQMDRAFQVDGLEIKPDKIILILTAAGEDPKCEFVQAAWESWEKQFNKEHRFRQLFHEKLLETWSVLTEVSTDSVEVLVRCPDEGSFQVRIFGETDGRILAEEYDLKTMGGDAIHIPFENLRDVYTGEYLDSLGQLDSLGRKRTVRKVRLAVGDYLLNHWYKGKGTPILYNVRIDTTASYYNEFTWEFSKLSHEVLEEGYYEYHRIKIGVQERNNQLELNWEFAGKFGSGILFPPRKNDYKLMETYYPKDMEDYEEILFKLIKDHLQRQP